jgi:hypothetical protein
VLNLVHHAPQCLVRAGAATGIAFLQSRERSKQLLQALERPAALGAHAPMRIQSPTLARR